MFTGGLSGTLASHLEPLGGAAALGVGANSLTPAIVNALPDAVRLAVQTASTYLAALVRSGFAQAKGENKGRVYIQADGYPKSSSAAAASS